MKTEPEKTPASPKVKSSELENLLKLVSPNASLDEIKVIALIDPAKPQHVKAYLKLLLSFDGQQWHKFHQHMKEIRGHRKRLAQIFIESEVQNLFETEASLKKFKKKIFPSFDSTQEFKDLTAKAIRIRGDGPKLQILEAFFIKLKRNDSSVGLMPLFDFLRLIHNSSLDADIFLNQCIFYIRRLVNEKGRSLVSIHDLAKLEKINQLLQNFAAIEESNFLQQFIAALKYLAGRNELQSDVSKDEIVEFSPKYMDGLFVRTDAQEYLRNLEKAVEVINSHEVQMSPDELTAAKELKGKLSQTGTKIREAVLARALTRPYLDQQIENVGRAISMAHIYVPPQGFFARLLDYLAKIFSSGRRRTEQPLSSSLSRLSELHLTPDSPQGPKS